MPATSEQPLRVCYFGTYRENYSRNQMMIAGLRLNGAIVIECHQTLWHGIEDRVRVVSGEWLKPNFWWRVISAYWQLLKTFIKVGDYDVLVVGYPGPFDIFLARILSIFKRKPLVWDVFMSIYLISVERGLDKKNRFSTKLIHLVEGKALQLPTMLILDTKEYVNWFTKNYHIPPERFRLVPTGADNRIFFPLTQSTVADNKFHILYSGTFIPNHGVMYIVEAARLLSNEPAINFEFIGNGPDREKAMEFAAQNKLTNVEFVEWMDKEQLMKHMNQADICLGAFGTTPQSLMTVQNKIFEAVAIGKPLISGDSPAIRQVFTHGENIFLCDRASGSALAEAILTLWKDRPLREIISRNGYELFTEKYDLLNNGKRFYTYLKEITK
jgi:glycosyltransferase involved in cell wall biosynthesis